MPFCHDRPDPVSCGVCRRYVADPAFAAVIDAVPPPDPARVARAAGKPVRLGRRFACKHEGAVLEFCTSCGPGKELRHVRDCAVHDRCTRGANGGAVASCSSCRDYEPDRPEYRWVSTADLVRDAVRLAALLPADCAGVVGVPRSGMIPAAVIAAQLHLPLHELAAAGCRPVAAGSRGGTLRQTGGPLAVVDDTVYAGSAMRRARAILAGRPAVFAAVYARPEAKDAADVFAVDLPSPHILEWNFANNGPVRGLAADPAYANGIGFDIDGVIVHDAESEGRLGSPYLVPRAHPVPLIATGRREKHRGVTEELLRSLGVRWDRLEMLPDDADGTTIAIADHKARHYAASGCGFFIESCPVQAGEIARLSGLPVICPAVGKVFQ